MRSFIVSALALTAIGLTGAPADGHPGRKHPCGVLRIADRAWQNHVDGKQTEWGTHWIYLWQGHEGGSCAKARSVTRRAVIHGPKARIPGGHCDWQRRQGPGIFITPFHQITCAIHPRLGWAVVAFVDPDPTFIHPGAAP